MLNVTQKTADLAVQVANLRARIAELEAENARLREGIETRKMIERAKGLIMRRYGWTEAAAYRALQKTSMETRTPMLVLAKRIVEGQEVKLSR